MSESKLHKVVIETEIYVYTYDGSDENIRKIVNKNLDEIKNSEFDLSSCCFSSYEIKKPSEIDNALLDGYYSPYTIDGYSYTSFKNIAEDMEEEARLKEIEEANDKLQLKLNF